MRSMTTSSRELIRLCLVIVLAGALAWSPAPSSSAKRTPSAARLSARDKAVIQHLELLWWMRLLDKLHLFIEVETRGPRPPKGKGGEGSSTAPKKKSATSR